MIRKKRLVATCIEMIKIESISGKEKNFANSLVTKLGALGCEVKQDSYGNVVGYCKGVGEPILLNAHLDTVNPGKNIRPHICSGIMRSDGRTILGADPKAGISIIVEVLASLKESNISHRSIEIVLTREEETTSAGAMHLSYKDIKAKEGIVFDGDGGPQNIFISSPSYYVLNIEIHGKSAHAGVEPEKGVSAIEIAAQLIASLPLGRIDAQTTMNIGSISGGEARNIVPDKVILSGEIRGRDTKKLKLLFAKIKKLQTGLERTYPMAKLTLSIQKELQGFLLNENMSFVKAVNSYMKKCKLQPQLKHAMGSSDANFFNEQGIDTVVLGTGVNNLHSLDEYLIIDDMYNAAIFCEAFIV